jgi:SAM-dependent methyltransferase
MENEVGRGASVDRTTRCRVCGGDFFTEPLLRYENMPRAAQFLPGLDSLASDRGVDLEICQCSACGLVQLSSAPVSYYKDVIRAAAVSGEMKEFRRQQFAAFAGRYSLEGKKVIEIGCGRGEYLSIMQQSGMDAYGLEHSQESVSLCERDGLKAAAGFIPGDASSLSGAPFEAFFMLNFLEHLPDPKSTLLGIGSVLTRDSVGLVEVPNFDMILRKNLFSELTSDHLSYFTRDTLSGALRLSGFDVVECDEIWHEYIISAVVRKRSKSDLSGFVRQQAALEAQLDRYIRRFGERRVAVWGAGHQALALICLLKLGNRIRYVVDSAPFKQGKYTAASHVPIVSPEALRSDPVDAVIVMAASYSDEVTAILRREFDRRLNVCILRDCGLEVV